MHKNKVYAPNSYKLRKPILKEMNNVPYARHIVCQNIIVVVRK